MKLLDISSRSLLLGLTFIASCVPSVSKMTDPPPFTSADTEAGDLGARPPLYTPASWPPAEPEASARGVTTPLPGEPDGDQLAAARLTQTSCEESESRVRDERIKKMRAAVDASFAAWLSHPACPGRRDCYDPDNRPRPAVPSWGRGGYPPMKSADRSSAPNSFPGGAMAGPMAAASPAPQAFAQMPAETSAPSSHASLGNDTVSGFAPPKAATGRPTRATSASGTNNQVAGVDEADIVKNDGTYVYIATNGALRIVEAMHPRLLSVTPVTGSPREMLVQNDRAVLFVATGSSVRKECKYAYDCSVASDGTSTRVIVYDIADRRSPRVVRELDFSGSLIAARRIGDTVHTVVADDSRQGGVSPYPTTLTDWSDLCVGCVRDVETVRERFEQLKRDNERRILAEAVPFPTVTENGAVRSLCEVMHPVIADGHSFTSIVSFDLANDREPITAATLESRPGTVFASEQGLYVAVMHEKTSSPRAWYAFADGAPEVSDIHKFHIGPSPRATRYVGSGVIPGHVLNQFAMDEWGGYLRVATTRGKVPNPDVSSSISILSQSQGGNLVRVGAVDNIAPQEDIRAVRFDDDRGYIVTFKKTDPLFVVDLSRPVAPRILGELKIPGFSTYLHRIDSTHLLSIGFDAQDHGSFAYFDGLLLQLFDVTNPTDPRLLHREKIGSRGSSSEAATDHLAFNFMASRGLLAIPVTTCEGGGDGRFGDNLTFSGLAVYNVSLSRGFHRLGGVDHGRRGANCQTWWSNAASQVKRSIFMDDLVFSIADDRMKVQRLERLGTDLADIPLTESRMLGVRDVDGERPN